jgi:Protein of unknown function (DUF3828)
MTFLPPSPAAWLRRSLLVGLVAFAMHPALPAFAAGTAADTSAKTFLTQIYQNYVGSSSGAAKGITLAAAKDVRGYFTVGLAGLILEDRASAAKKGEPPALDGDPFVGHQEWDISDLAVDVKDKPAAAKAVGTVTFNNAGKPEKVVIELLRNGRDWRIADIKWDASSLRSLYRKKTDASLAH